MILPFLKDLQKLKIILASTSPRRKQLLELVGLSFRVWTSSFDEKLFKTSFIGLGSRTSSPSSFWDNETARIYVLHMARGKAQATLSMLNRQDWHLIIAADTIVLMDGEILEKPSDRTQAALMLRQLSGKTHSVLTAVVFHYDRQIVEFVEESRVTFASLPEDVIEAYLDTNEFLDKAGSYAIQGVAASFIESIDGCYYNVMGFPLYRFCHHLRDLLLSNQKSTQMSI